MPSSLTSAGKQSQTREEKKGCSLQRHGRIIKFLFDYRYILSQFFFSFLLTNTGLAGLVARYLEKVGIILTMMFQMGISSAD